MKIRGNYSIQFAVPDNWLESREENRYIFHGPRGQELIISGAAISAEDKSEYSNNSTELEEKLLNNAFLAMQHAAQHPDLKVIKDLAPEPSCKLRCWTIFSQTRNDDRMFSQAVVSYSGHVVLITLETPYAENASEEFRNIISNIEQPKINE